jgi:kinesin family protein 18/19
MKLLFQGNKERTQEPTAANKTSSRSHAVLQVIVKQQNRVRNTLQEIRVGKLFMIDLAMYNKSLFNSRVPVINHFQ